MTTNLIITTKEGKIDQVLNRKGKGPGEYLTISDFNSEPITKDLWTYDESEQNPWNTRTGEGYLYHILGMVDNKLVLYATNIDIKEVVSKLNPTGTKLDDKSVLDKIDPESQLANPILVFVDFE